MSHRFSLALLAGLVLVSCRSAAPPLVEPVEPVAPIVEEPEYSNKLRWSTASEVDNFGFDIYRSELEEGPFDRLTDDPLPGAGTTDLPSQYEYVDEEIDPDTTYYYYVESISLQGVREQFTPIIRAPAKRSQQADADADSGAGSAESQR